MKATRILTSALLLCLLALRPSEGMAQGYDPAKVGRKAAALYRQAMERAGEGDYAAAAALIGKSLEAEPGFVDALLSLAGLSGEMKDYAQAAAHYEKAFALDEEYTREYRLPYAINLGGLGRFTDAVQALEAFLTIPNLGDASRKAGEYRMRCFTFAVETAARRAGDGYVFTPRNLGDSVNSAVSEYYPSLTIDGRTLIYTRRVRNIDEDFYTSRRAEESWGNATGLSGNINTNLNEGAQTVSQDGQLLVFTGCNFPEGYGNCDLYFSVKTRQGWSQPANLGGRINTESWESAPCLSPDKRHLYFASGRPGGYGGTDIYVAHRMGNGQWSTPENLGPGINTPGNESCPFMHADNQTLYFTSNGHLGYGGDDLFHVRRQPDGGWSKPENLGYPINTIENEGSLVVAADGRTAYYASDRSDSKGGLDLYTFELREDVRPLRTLWVEGNVHDAKSGNGLPSAVDLVDLATGNVLSRVQTDEDGYYLVTLPLGRDYGFHVNRKGYLFYSGNFPYAQKAPDSTYRMDIPLHPIELDANIVLRNIFFETNSYALKPESASELDVLARLLTENPTIRVRINGHTDNIGKPADNLVLSNNRAKAVVDYLKAKGIAADRLSHQGFGATNPLADNATEEGRARNRRTEMQVTGR